MSLLVELGDCYWALGLPAAARSVLARALAASNDVVPALRLADIALAQGDAAAARAYASEAAKRAPGPATRVLLGRALVAAGELAAARMSLSIALDAPTATPWDRARAHLELARAADAQSDAAGAGAQAAAAFDAVLTAAQTPPLELDVIEASATAVVAHGRAADASASLDPVRGLPGAHACAAALYAARQAAGDTTVTDSLVDDELAQAQAEVGTAAAAAAALRLRRLERRARNREAREPLLTELDAFAHTSASEPLGAAERARLYFLRAALCEDDPHLRDRAEDAYRKGLAFQPGHTGAACRLALLVLERGDHVGALAEIERALRIDASYGIAWRNAARMLDATSPTLRIAVSKLLDAANPGAGSAAGGVAPRLVTATAEVARHDVLDGVYAHGHRVKNLLGIIGARTRSARKLAERPEGERSTSGPLRSKDHEPPGPRVPHQRVPEGDQEVASRLRELESDVTALYEEWAHYLRSMQAPTPTIELVAFAPVLNEVVIAAQARLQHVPITLELHGSMPELRGDRTLLREALLNVVSNAAEACAHLPGAAPGEVSVRARALASPGLTAAPILEVVVADTGPGIPRAHLGRLFVPGFTTKDTGSGVGLAIAERAITAHHGRITVESEEGRGTTITITLPTDKHGLAVLPRWESR